MTRKQLILACSAVELLVMVLLVVLFISNMMSFKLFLTGVIAVGMASSAALLLIIRKYPE